MKARERRKQPISVTLNYAYSLILKICRYPSQARLMFKCRTQTVDIKTHLTYKYVVDSVCRKCGEDDETYSHIVNCGSDVIEVIDVSSVTDMDNEIKRKVQQCLGRVRDFLNDNT